MKTKLIQSMILASGFMIAGSIGQALYSGIYAGNISGMGGYKMALTKGGHAYGGGNDADGYRDLLDPARSVINAKGSFKGATPSGVSVSGTISSTFKVSGTLKESGRTHRLSGSRSYK